MIESWWPYKVYSQKSPSYTILQIFIVLSSLPVMQKLDSRDDFKQLIVL